MLLKVENWKKGSRPYKECKVLSTSQASNLPDLEYLDSWEGRGVQRKSDRFY